MRCSYPRGMKKIRNTVSPDFTQLALLMGPYSVAWQHIAVEGLVCKLFLKFSQTCFSIECDSEVGTQCAGAAREKIHYHFIGRNTREHFNMDLNCKHYFALLRLYLMLEKCQYHDAIVSNVNKRQCYVSSY